jgi:hypothetical protein
MITPGRIVGASVGSPCKSFTCQTWRVRILSQKKTRSLIVCSLPRVIEAWKEINRYALPRRRQQKQHFLQGCRCHPKNLNRIQGKHMPSAANPPCSPQRVTSSRLQNHTGTPRLKRASQASIFTFFLLEETNPLGRNSGLTKLTTKQYEHRCHRIHYEDVFMVDAYSKLRV